MRAWVRWLEACVLAACLLFAGPANAHFDPADAGDYSFHERQLCYTLHPDVAKDPNWVQWIDQAVAAWNAVAAQTGWSFRPCADGEAADISINFASGESAGGSFGEDSDQAQHRGQNLKSKHYDLKLNPDVSGMTLDGIKIEGGHQGWDTTGAKTLDPVQVVMHELTHAMRLSHKPSEGWNDGKAGSTFYYERPVAPGIHTGAISADDIAQTHAAAAEGKPAANFHYPLPDCFADEAARAKARDDLQKIMDQFQATIDRDGKDLVGEHDPDVQKGLYAQGRQAMSNLEASRETLKALDAVKPCPGHAMRNVGQTGQVALATAVIDEINLARTDPAAYARKLEGDPAAAEAVAFLRRQTPLPALILDMRLQTAATRHAADQGQAGGDSHVGTDGSTIRDRLQATGVYSMILAEEMSLGQSTAAGVVRQLLIDPNNPARPHRSDLFNALLKFIGVACGPHRSLRSVCVVDMTASQMTPGAGD